MATVDSAKATLVNKIDSLTSSATAKDTIFLAKALKEGSNSIGTGSAGQVLKTDSAGTGVEWATDGGLPSGGTAGQVVTNTTAGVGTWQDSAVGGKVLQVLQTTHSATTQYSVNSNYVDISGLSVTITPSSTSSKILVIASVQIGGNAPQTSVRLIRGTTRIGDNGTSTGSFMTQGWSNGYVTVTTANSYLDSPNTTSATTYKLTLRVHAGNWAYTNRAESNEHHEPISTITVMEIGA